MQRYLIAFFFHCSLLTAAQPTQDWENYILSVDGKPVSINVDLGLGEHAPLKGRSYVMIVRTKIINPDSRGMPYPEEELALMQMEDSLISSLSNATGAVFAGMFTQRGLREFYYYAPDTIGFNMAVNGAMKNFKQYEWLGKGKKDASWENYFTVLYPSDLELLAIKSKRQIELMKRTIQLDAKPIDIVHTFIFSDSNGRDKFLRNIPFQGFEILSMQGPTASGPQNFLLVLKRSANIGLQWVDQFIIPLAKAAQMNKGKFVDWTIDIH